jgi:hypothetical protein
MATGTFDTFGGWLGIRRVEDSPLWMATGTFDTFGGWLETRRVEDSPLWMATGTFDNTYPNILHLHKLIRHLSKYTPFGKWSIFG